MDRKAANDNGGATGHIPRAAQAGRVHMEPGAVLHAANDNIGIENRDPIEETYRKGLLHLSTETNVTIQEAANELNFKAACDIRYIFNVAAKSHPRLEGLYGNSSLALCGGVRVLYTDGGDRLNATEAYADRHSLTRMIERMLGEHRHVIKLAVLEKEFLRKLALPGTPQRQAARAGRDRLVNALEIVGTEMNLEAIHLAMEIQLRAA